MSTALSKLAAFAAIPAALLLLSSGLQALLAVGHSSIWIDEWLQWMNALRPEARGWVGQGLGETLWISPIRWTTAAPSDVLGSFRIASFSLALLSAAAIAYTARKEKHLRMAALGALAWLIPFSAAGRPFAPSMAGLAWLAAMPKGAPIPILAAGLCLLHPVGAAFLFGAALLNADWRRTQRIALGTLSILVLMPTGWSIFLADRTVFPPALATAVIHESKLLPRWLPLDAPHPAELALLVATLLFGVALLWRESSRRDGAILVGWFLFLAVLRATGAPVLVRYFGPAVVWAAIRPHHNAADWTPRNVWAVLAVVSAIFIPSSYLRNPEAAAPPSSIRHLGDGTSCRIRLHADGALATLNALDQIMATDFWLPGGRAETMLDWPFADRNAKCRLVVEAALADLLEDGTSTAYANLLSLDKIGQDAAWRNLATVKGDGYHWSLQIPQPTPVRSTQPEPTPDR